GKHFWGIGYGAWSTGNMSEKMVEEYLEHHESSSNKGGEDFMLE
ncbi:MAG: IS200/IS605 family transposase, partial [Snowella sp.]